MHGRNFPPFRITCIYLGTRRTPSSHLVEFEEYIHLDTLTEHHNVQQLLWREDTKLETLGKH